MEQEAGITQSKPENFTLTINKLAPPSNIVEKARRLAAIVTTQPANRGVPVLFLLEFLLICCNAHLYIML